MSTTPPPLPSDPAGSDEVSGQDGGPVVERPTTPTDPGVPDASAPASGSSADAQPTVPFASPAAFPAAAPDGAPTLAYGAPPAPYGAPPAGSATPPAPYGAPPAAYGAPPAPYGAPSAAYGAPPTAPDTRPRGLATTSLILAVAGLILVLVGFFPLVWVGLITTLVGGLVLLAAFVTSLIALIAKRHGGTALSISAVVVSVIGGAVGVFALLVAVLFTGLSTSSTIDPDALPAPLPSIEVSDGTESLAPGAPTDAAHTVEQQAFLSDVRGQLNEVMTDIDPSVTAEDIEEVLSDDMLIMTGQQLLLTGEAGIDALVDQAAAAAGGAGVADDTVDTTTLRNVFEIIYHAAQDHLR